MSAPSKCNSAAGNPTFTYTKRPLPMAVSLPSRLHNISYPPIASSASLISGLQKLSLMRMMSGWSSGHSARSWSIYVDGKFSYSQVMKCGLVNKFQTTVDENGKFGYFKADMRPVPPGWYDLDKTKHKVPIGWYQMEERK